MHWSWSISILTHNKWRKHIWSVQLHPTFRHCTEELPPTLRLRHIILHVFVTSFKRRNNVTPSNAMNDVIFPLTNDVSYLTLSQRFQSCESLFDISHIFNIGSIGEVCKYDIYIYWFCGWCKFWRFPRFHFHIAQIKMKIKRLKFPFLPAYNIS